MFIIIEGPDGSGKSSVATELYNFAKALSSERHSFPKPTKVRFPDNESIREVILQRKRRLTNFQELSLFAADMFITASNIINPLNTPLERTNNLVIGDRYYYSTFIYQMLASSRQHDGLANIMLKSLVDNMPTPDFVFVLHANDHVLNSRLSARQKDAIESDSHAVARSREIYRRLPEIIRVDSIFETAQPDVIYNFDTAQLSAEHIAEDIYEMVNKKIDELKGL